MLPSEKKKQEEKLKKIRNEQWKMKLYCKARTHTRELYIFTECKGETTRNLDQAERN